MSQALSFSQMQALLRGVSRSFYLSIRLLPGGLRQPIALAYLLARATDTLADAGALPVAERTGHLARLSAAVDGRVPAGGDVAELRLVLGPDHDPQERLLLASLPQCLDWLHGLAPADREDIRTVLRHIVRGQALDLERFRDSAPRALADAAQLAEYTYLVAGSVGEFWTDLCMRHVDDFARAPQATMRALGRDYGNGLQLINILRDGGNDLAQGRCYFPADELAAAGLAPSDIVRNPGRFEPVWQHWRSRAALGLAQGMRYTDAVNSRRVRAATGLPALIGARTLALLDAAGPARLQRRIKVPRQQVRAVLVRLALAAASRTSLKAQFAR
ncbi:MAG: squalene/phytoene synthase family protein, partial [Ramlibacter sp.]